jgi:hypothetical protein
MKQAGVEQADVEQAGVKRATEDHQEDSLPDDRLQPLPAVSPQTEPTLPLVAREEAIAPPPAPMLQTSVVEDVPKILDLADTIIAATIPAISEPIIPPGTSPKLAAIATDPIDFSEVIAKSNMELKRLGWSSDQGRNYLLQTYGKRSRQLLSDEELLEFLLYLESLPTPVRA